LKNLANTLQEAISSLNDAIIDDQSLISQINGFTSSLVLIPSMEEQIALVERCLKEDNKATKLVKKLIEEVRKGNIELLINTALGGVAQITSNPVGRLVKEVINPDAPPQTTSINPILEVGLGSIESIFKDVGSCVQALFGHNQVAGAAQQATEKLDEKILTELENLAADVAETYYIDDIINESLNVINDPDSIPGKEVFFDDLQEFDTKILDLIKEEQTLESLLDADTT
jgi:hypothetical protein